MTKTYEINPITPEVRDVLTACLGWIRRIEDRHETQGAFLDNTDIKPLRKKLEAILDGKITDRSAAIVEEVFVASGAVK